MIDPYTREFDLLDNFDIVTARQCAREIARDLGFSLTDQARFATAVSEVARHALQKRGSISFTIVESAGRRGIQCICRGCAWPTASDDRGPANPGSGILGGIERLLDEFVVRPEGSPTVIMRKWLR
jgi:serine/threonine-protein kinase RsbT